MIAKNKIQDIQIIIIKTIKLLVFFIALLIIQILLISYIFFFKKIELLTDPIFLTIILFCFLSTAVLEFFTLKYLIMSSIKIIEFKDHLHK